MSVIEGIGSSAPETEALTQQTGWEGPGRGGAIVPLATLFLWFVAV